MSGRKKKKKQMRNEKKGTDRNEPMAIILPPVQHTAAAQLMGSKQTSRGCAIHARRWVSIIPWFISRNQRERKNTILQPFLALFPTRVHFHFVVVFFFTISPHKDKVNRTKITYLVSYPVSPSSRIYTPAHTRVNVVLQSVDGTETGVKRQSSFRGGGGGAANHGR